MHFKFDSNYIHRAGNRVAMIVVNGVVSDSRVLKTAQTVSKLGFQVCVYGLNNKDAISKIERHPFEIVLLPDPRAEMKRLGNWPADPKNRDYEMYTDIFSNHIQEYLKQKPPSFIHTHDMIGLAIGGKLYEQTKEHNAFWIHDIHEYVQGLTEIEREIQSFFCGIEEKFIHGPDVLTSVSPALNEILQGLYSLETKPSLVLNAPRLTDFDPYYHKDIRTALGMQQDVPLLVYSGGVKPIRGVRTLVEALPLLPDVHVAIVTNNTGSFVMELKQTAQELGVNDRIHFHPYVPFSNVSSFLRTANIGVHPIQRYPNAEIALPNKLFEYIHAGLPVIVSDNRSMKEFVGWHDFGIAFEAGNSCSLAEAVIQALNRQRSDPAWRDSIRSLSKKYCWETQEAVIADIYETLSQRKSSPLPRSGNEKGYRVLQLPVSGAGQPSALAKAMKDKDVFASSLAIGKNKFEYEADLDLKYAPNDPAFVKELSDSYISKYSVFHFHVRPLLFSKHYHFPTGMDLIMLRCAGKKVFFHFRGSEARLASVFENCSPYNYVPENPDSLFSAYLEEEQRVFIEFVSGVCHKVFVPDPELQTYVPEALIVPRIIDLKKWQYTKTEPSDVLRVVHAPSRPVVKGTKEVLAAIEKLKSEGTQIDFQLVENMPNDKAVELYKWADVIIDQLRIGWYGVLAIEAMALGKAAISYIRDDLKHYLPHPFPLAIANPDNLYHVLKDLALNPGKAHSIGLRGRKYVEELHDSGQVSDILLQLYEAEGNPFDMGKAFELLSFQRTPRKNKNKASKNTFSLSVIKYLNKDNFAIFYHIVRHDGIRPAIREAFNKLSGR